MEQKLDSELSLALSLPEEERMRNAVLRSGYDPGSRIWTLLLLYHGSLDEIEAALPVSIVPLLGSYAVIRIPAEKIPALLAFPQVLYLELSRPLYEETITGIAESCMDTVLPVLPGSGALIGPDDSDKPDRTVSPGSGTLIGPDDSDEPDRAVSPGPGTLIDPDDSIKPDRTVPPGPGGSLTTGDSLATGEGGGTLTGRGTAIAILDSGVDYRHPDFCTADGATRILTYWDQTLDYDGMNRYGVGRIFSKEELDRLLTAAAGSGASGSGAPGDLPVSVPSAGTVAPDMATDGGAADGGAPGEQTVSVPSAGTAVPDMEADDGAPGGQTVSAPATEAPLPEPSADFSGHGTHIAGICAGNGRASGGRNRGAAPESSLLVVKLKNDADSVFTDYANLMMAVDYVVRFASDAALPLSINISYGSNDGPHDGSGLMERYLNNCIFYGKNVVVTATGNEGISRRHSHVQVSEDTQSAVPFSVAPGENSLYLQLFKHYGDTFTYRLSPPDGSGEILIPGRAGIYRFSLGNNLIRLIISDPTPYQSLQELFLVLLPAASGLSLSSGVWQFHIQAESVVSGSVNLWLPSREATNAATGFLSPSVDGTLTIPSTAANVISVSGYDSTTDTFASFSGRGFLRGPVSDKPDLTAPAVNILSTAPGGGYSIKSGTSMAAPFVSGAASLLMEYGIVQGRDLFLYGEKIKALLQKGARPLPAFSEYPNPSVGWGALCLKNSLPASTALRQ